jgi:threonine synthase
VGTPYRCQHCSGTFDIPILPEYHPESVEEALPGVWRYRHTFGLEPKSPVVTIGEANTPLIWRDVFGKKIAFKLEFNNPTGSFKDRGSAVLVSFLLSRGVSEAVEDSSGNAGASFAAYAAASGMKARVFVPDYASGPKRQQIEAYGAEVVRILGTRAKTTEAALRYVDNGAVYASHAFMPHGLAGYATLAYEIYQQLGGEPGTVITPAGQGGLLLGVGRGFESLRRAGQIKRLPALVGIQALACAPLWALHHYGAAGLGWVAEGDTLAEGVRVRHPLRGDLVLQMVRESGGDLLAVDEPDILPGREALAALGFYVEPTSAIVWKALEMLGEQLRDPVVVILTGTGLKSP